MKSNIMTYQANHIKKGMNQRFVFHMITASLCRILLNTARRFAYPFAPVLSRGLEVPLTSITSMIAVNQATGLIGIVFGPLSDRLGYRLMMMTGLGMLVLGMFAAGFFPFYLVVLAALFLAGLGKNVFDPAIQAYVGKKISFKKRGLIIGGQIWLIGGINASSMASAFLTFLGMLALIWGLRHWKT